VGDVVDSLHVGIELVVGMHFIRDRLDSILWTRLFHLEIDISQLFKV
jgi:hypothetical protein